MEIAYILEDDMDDCTKFSPDKPFLRTIRRGQILKLHDGREGAVSIISIGRGRIWLVIDGEDHDVGVWAREVETYTEEYFE